jgi:hypothetical protein
MHPPTQLQPAKSLQPAKVYTLPCGGQLTVSHVDLLPNVGEFFSTFIFPLTSVSTDRREFQWRRNLFWSAYLYAPLSNM